MLLKFASFPVPGYSLTDLKEKEPFSAFVDKAEAEEYTLKNFLSSKSAVSLMISFAPFRALCGFLPAARR